MTIKKLFAPQVTAPILALICSSFLAVADNNGFFKAAFSAINSADQNNVLFEIALFLGLVLLFFIILLLIASFKPVFKVIYIIIMLLAALISYFMDNYGVIVNTDMIRNIMQTDVSEATELLTPKLLFHVVFFGLLPSIWIYRTKILYRNFRVELTTRLLILCGSMLLLAAIVFFNYKDFSFILRNNHHLRYLVNPNYPLYSLVKYFKADLHGKVMVRELGADAKQINSWQNRGKKAIVVLVVGETARAENFALNGYGQATNPRLGKEDIINFPNTHSCGTATAVSLPCMFSNLKQVGFSDAEAKQNENLLDVLKHAGLNVLWLDNNAGCKGVCQRVVAKNTEILHVDSLCAEGECYDEVMLAELNAALKNISNDTFVVLHQKGSHGPAYYKRHPERFKKFLPECARNEVQDCPQEEIKNAYDNTILYTDYILAEVIAILKANSARYHTAMVYMSDHGESLGENGIYLHGLPYAFAPEQQTHIPFIMWLSESFNKSFKLNIDCLKQHSHDAYSHDNLFHSVLGMLDVHTNVYEANYDIFSSCRNVKSLSVK